MVFFWDGIEFWGLSWGLWRRDNGSSTVSRLYTLVLLHLCFSSEFSSPDGPSIFSLQGNHPLHSSFLQTAFSWATVSRREPSLIPESFSPGLKHNPSILSWSVGLACHQSEQKRDRMFRIFYKSAILVKFSQFFGWMFTPAANYQSLYLAIIMTWPSLIVEHSNLKNYLLRNAHFLNPERDYR